MSSLKNRTNKQNFPQDRAISKWSSLLFVFFLLSVSLVLVFFIFRETHNLDQILHEIDSTQNISVQKIPSLNVYRGALGKAGSEVDYLRILKRGYAIKNKDTREQYLDVITQAALKEFPKNENLWAYRVSTLLEMGDFAGAALAAKHLENTQYLPLKGEILVRSLAQLRSSLTENSSIAEIVSDSPDSAATYISLARLFTEPRFIFDSAILHMVRGDKERALGLIRELQGQAWLDPFAAGLIAYDNEAWELAIEFFEQQSTPNILNLEYLGDCYARLGQYEKVIEVLSEARQLVDEDSSVFRETSAVSENTRKDLATLGTWQLFYNLSSAYHEVGNDLKAFEVLRQGRAAFPHSSHLLLLLNAVAPPDEREYTRSILSEFVDSKSNIEPKLALALLIFDRSRGNRQKFSSDLWQLFSSFPKYDQILRYLLWYFIGLNQTDDVYLALDRYRNLVLREDEGKNVVYRDFPDWAKEYMGINALLKGDFATAENVFSDIKKPNWYTYYNMANARIYKSDFATAVRMLRRALDSTQDFRNRISIFYRMVVLNQISEQNYFSAQDLDEIENAMRSYVQSNYQRKAEGSDVADERFYAKLDSLILWYKQSNNNTLVELKNLESSP